MGQLLSQLTQRHDSVQIFLDFDNAVPSPKEQDLWNEIHLILQIGPQILDQLKAYSGCEAYIRSAISAPSPETEDAAWNKLLPCVDQLRDFYEYSLKLETLFPKLFVALCQDDPQENLSNQQALAKQLGMVFDFALRFDNAKMINPAIQNDFSYYRRSLSRMKIAKKDADIKVRDDLANRMSLFYAYPTPMMNMICDTTSKVLTTNMALPLENVTKALACYANICADMVEKRRFANQETSMFCLRVMTGAIVLYDHICPTGVFRKSPVNMKAAIGTLKSFPGDNIDGLVNSLRFTTKHLNDPDTPSNIKQMLAE